MGFLEGPLRSVIAQSWQRGRFGEPALRTRLERLGVVPGRVFSEEYIGTNSIATALEVGRGVAVRADEHYIESLRQFSCHLPRSWDRSERSSAKIMGPSGCQ